MLDRVLHRLKLSHGVDVRACSAPTIMSNSTKRAMLYSSELERTASLWVVVLTCGTPSWRTVRPVHSKILAWQLRARRRRWHIDAFEDRTCRRC